MRAQFDLGCAYTYGKEVAKDPGEAAKWFRKSAEQGCEYGQLGLGLSYADGRGGVKDEEEAVRWLRKAAALGEQQRHRDAFTRWGASHYLLRLSVHPLALDYSLN